MPGCWVIGVGRAGSCWLRLLSHLAEHGGLDVDGHGQTFTELHRPGVPRTDEALEAEAAQRALELVGGEAGQQHRRPPVDMLREEGQVEVVGVEVGDVEVVGSLDRLADPRRQLVVAREDEPRTEERGHEPRIADDRGLVGLDQDPGVAERGGTHRPQAAGRSAPGQPTRTGGRDASATLSGRAGP